MLGEKMRLYIVLSSLALIHKIFISKKELLLHNAERRLRK